MRSEQQPSTGVGIRGSAGETEASSVRLCFDDVIARRRGCVSTRGTSVLEFALVAPMFFLLFFAVFDFSRLFYSEMTLQNAVRTAGRYASTGNHLPDPQHQGQNLSRVNSIIQVAQQAALGLMSPAFKSPAWAGEGQRGWSGRYRDPSLTTNLKLLTPFVAQFFNNGTYTFTVSVTFRNEPFPPSNTS